MNDLPKDFDYPDVGAEGIETEKSTIGPGQYIQMTIGVSLADAQAVMRQERSLFVWGWIEYDDIFENTPRRRTEVCVQVEVNADCRSCTPTVVGLFNGADDDCHHKPKT